jgi:hypothetical protein
MTLNLKRQTAEIDKTLDRLIASSTLMRGA